MLHSLYGMKKNAGPLHVNIHNESGVHNILLLSVKQTQVFE